MAQIYNHFCNQKHKIFMFYNIFFKFFESQSRYTIDNQRCKRLRIFTYSL